VYIAITLDSTSVIALLGVGNVGALASWIAWEVGGMVGAQKIAWGLGLRCTVWILAIFNQKLIILDYSLCKLLTTEEHREITKRRRLEHTLKPRLPKCIHR
jgi:hypothetical protein